MTYEPFKCPDCKTWWRTATHKCEEPVAKVSFADTCGYCKGFMSSKIPHVCKPVRYKEFKQKDKKGNPYDPEDGSTKWHS